MLSNSYFNFSQIQCIQSWIDVFNNFHISQKFCLTEKFTESLKAQVIDCTHSHKFQKHIVYKVISKRADRERWEWGVITSLHMYTIHSALPNSPCWHQQARRLTKWWASWINSGCERDWAPFWLMCRWTDSIFFGLAWVMECLGWGWDGSMTWDSISWGWGRIRCLGWGWGGSMTWGSSIRWGWGGNRCFGLGWGRIRCLSRGWVRVRFITYYDQVGTRSNACAKCHESSFSWLVHRESCRSLH
jgi:hypothetical protein